MTVRPLTAMVLAAGLATRMRPLTDDTAKPLLTLEGVSLLDHSLNRLAAAGVETVAVNGFWHADKIEAALRARTGAPATVFLRETTLLDTGGGVLNALPVLGEGPFYVINGDAFWLDGPTPALIRLAQAFDDSVDAVLLVQRTFQIAGAVGQGDFALNQLGVPRRRREREVVPYLYAGVHLMRASLLDGMAPGPFSMNLAWNRAMEAGRLRAIVHDGPWFHLSTPADLVDAERRLEARMTVDTPHPWL
jgi:MurNAc alpha-1-phosphate uridylyltransferase